MESMDRVRIIKGNTVPHFTNTVANVHIIIFNSALDDYMPLGVDVYTTGETVTVIVNSDNVSQEGLETFSLELTPIGPVPQGYFFKSTLLVVVRDTTEVNIQFSQPHYSASENETAVLATVTSSAALASPLTLAVSPLSYAAAMARHLPLPAALPPAATSGSDFSSGNLTVTLPASQVPGSVLVELPLVDDLEIEVAEEGFVAVLDLVGAVEPSLVILGPTRLTIATIQEDDTADPVVVGFTKEGSYQSFEGGAAVRVCVGVRGEGSVETLQAPVTLQLTASALTSPATQFFPPTDFPANPATLHEDFLPLSMTLSISPDTPNPCAEITIIDDDITEASVEFFEVSLTLTSLPLPYISLQSPATTFISIVDDEALKAAVRDITSRVSQLEPSVAGEKLGELLDLILMTGQPASEEFSESFLTAVSDVFTVLEGKPGTAQDSNGESGVGQVRVATKLLQGLDTFALRAFNPDQAAPVVDGLKLVAQLLERGSMPEGPLMGISVGDSEIILPPEVVSMSDSDQVRIASFFFENLTGVLPDAMSEMNDSMMLASPVISATVGCRDSACPILLPGTSQPVRIVLTHTEKGSEFEANCAFWEIGTQSSDSGEESASGRWSTVGCDVVESNDTITICECYHLTHFAILLSPNLNVTEEHAFALQVIGYVGVSISLLCLVLTVCALLFLKSLWGMRNYIHINLCISLFVAQLTFIVGVDKTENEQGCQAVAILLHYFFLVTFMWMLMEGVVLYVALVRVFTKGQKLYIATFTIVSYGLPALYMCVTVPLGMVLKDAEGSPHYGGEACWLRYDTGFIWAFIAPVLLIIFINIGFFIMAIYIMFKHEKRQARKSKMQSFSHWLKSSISLLIIMGITWIIGVLAFHEALLTVAYIFTIFVAFQGTLIFILFIPISKQVRDSYKKWWRGKVAESEFLSKHFSSEAMERRLGRFSSMRTTSFRMSKYDRTSSLHEDAAKISKEQEVFQSYNGIQLGSFDPPPASDSPSPPPITHSPSPPPTPSTPSLPPSFSAVLEPPSPSTGVQFNIVFMTEATLPTQDGAQLEQQRKTSNQTPGEGTSL